ncbi:hypothetical protein BAMA_14090 [Bacillus manliponensis]|uniref:DUF2487 domain-containing protein n=1 Tax=Bacillus manliponensis TaxID=574376 RepID=A0A073KE21_9BACI|nr:YpiF family protein [Bacillus manliponensis]KEK20543.1 hypothetical protein BAMA_14090 [Bacillus manliponensis]
MKWLVADAKQYEQAKEYIDTAIIPLLSISLVEKMRNTVGEGEFLTTFANELEREYKGRIFLLPAFTYIEQVEENTSNRLKEWTSYLQKQGFQHVLYVTSDVSWKSAEEELTGELFYVSALPLEQLSEQAKREVIQTQVGMVAELLIKKWENNK